MAEDMQHIIYGWMWHKVNSVDLSAAGANFHESSQKKLYASHSKFQHNKKIVSESDGTNFSCVSAAHGQG